MNTTDQSADDFIQRWQDKDGTEKANFQLFLTELCELLEVDKPDPASGDNELNAYVFERRVDMPQPDGKVNRGFIDLYRRGCFVLEGKQSGQKLDSGGWDKAMLRAHAQADAYIRALPVDEGKPPFLLVTDVGRSLEIYAEFSRSGSTYTPFPDSNSHRLKLDDLRKPEIRERLAKIWTAPDKLDPSKRAAKVTRHIANLLAELAKSLEKQHGAEVVGAFLMRCLFTMFAEDVGLLPKNSFTNLLDKLYDRPESFAPALQNLWTLMDRGGYDAGTMEQIRRFNGGLFAHAEALALSPGQIQMLYQAARADWRYVEPAIFGTLLERALNPNERHKLGAHYTPRAYVERLVLPTVLEPLRQEWRDVQAAAAVLESGGKKNSHDKALEEVRAFHHRLCGLRILDPACGSGNFLYVTLEHMKRLEGEVLNTLADMGDTQGRLEMESVAVNPQQFLGLEVNPRAAAIAEMVLWIGYLQWHFRTHGNVAPAEPILRDFHNIENRDAVLAYDGVETVLDEAAEPVTRWDGRTTKPHPVTGKEVPDESARVPVLRYLNPRKAEWPQADYIIGNPPFIGAAPMRAALGDGYVEALRKTWKEVPESSDFVMYWWHKAAETVRAGGAQRFGFITTNSLRQTFNRRVVQKQLEDKKPLSLIFAIPDHPWVDSADGAAVRIAMTVGQAGDHAGVLQTVVSESTTDGEDAYTISIKSRNGKLHADLTAGANVSAAGHLRANEDLSNRGFCLFGQGFVITPKEAIQLGLGAVEGAERHIKNYRNGRDIAQTPRNVMVIDVYGLTADEVRQQHPLIYQHLLEHVKPERDNNNRESRRKNWWIFGEPNPKLRQQLANLTRYILTVETSKHRFFVFLDTSILPDNMLVNIAVEDDFQLGILSSRIHILWALVKGSDLGPTPRYNKSVCFETFPFPDATEAQKSKIRDLAEQIDAHRKRQQSQHEKLTLTNLYNVLEKLRKEEPLNEKEQQTHQQGLVAILRELHDDLDRAVFNAYGWDDLAAELVGKPGATTPLPDKPEAQAQAEEELLSRLVDLNTQRAAEEAQGHIRWLRPDFQAPEAQTTITATQQTDNADQVTETVAAPAAKLIWPKVMKDQAKIVRELLAATPMPADALAAQFKRKPKGVQDVLDALVDLGVILEEENLYRLVSNTSAPKSPS
ncbi:MAG: type IIL restriction-modification enzyme MmeI [Thiolinea sp.]